MAKEKSNLLVTFDPSHLESAKKEIEELLKGIKEEAKILTAADGLAEVSVENARKVIQKLSKIAKESIEKFNRTMSWTPIDTWAKNSIEDMKKKIKGFVKDIGKNERWKMDLRIRRIKGKKLDPIKLILKLTEVVNRKKVDLKKPEKIIKVEILGKKAGLSLLKPEDLLQIAKLKHK